MPDENVQKIGMDASDFVAGSTLIEHALRGMGINFDEVIDSVTRFDKSGNLVSIRLKQLSEDGLVTTQVFSKLKNQFDATIGALRDSRTGQATTDKLSAFGLTSTSISDNAQTQAQIELNSLLKESVKIQKELDAEHARREQRLEREFQLEQQIAAQAKVQQVAQSISLNLPQQIQPGFSPVGADPNKILSLNTAIGGFNKAIQASGLNAQQAGQLIQNVLGGAITNLTVQNPAAVAAIGNVQRQMANFNNVVPPAVQQVNGLQQALLNLASRAGSILLSIGILEVTQAIRSSIKDSNDFARQLAEIGTISQGSTVGMGEFRDKIIETSNAFGLARKDVAEGLYQTLSNQIGDANDSLRFTGDAAKFAKAAVSSQSDSVNLLSSALNSFQLNANNAQAVSASFFKTIELGRLRASDLANTYGTVGVVAHELGISYNEVNAALAQLTISGVTASNAQTFLRNLFVSLIKPSKELKEVFLENGFSSGIAAIQTLGFEGVLKLLSKSVDGNIAKFAELAPNIRALQPLLNLASDGGSQFAKTLEKIQGGVENYNAAVGIVVDDSSTKFDKIFATLSNATLSIGDTIRKSVVSIVDAFGGIEAAINNVKATFIGLSVGITVSLIPTLVALSETILPAAVRGLRILRLELLANPYAVAGLLVATLVKELIDLKDTLADIEKEQRKTIQSMAENVDFINGIVNKQANDSATKQVEIVSSALALMIVKYQDYENQAKKTYANIATATNDLGQSLVQSQNRIIRNLENENQKSDKTIADAKQKFEKDIVDLKVKQFELDLEGGTIQLELTSRILEKERLISISKQESAAGNNTAALEALNLAEKQQEKISQISVKLKQVASEYVTFTTETTRQAFSLQERIIDLSFTKISKTFTKLEKSLKDVFDKTGDSSGLSKSFLRGFTAELEIAGARTQSSANRLINNLDRLQSRGKAAVIDTATQELINGLDGKTRKELLYNIRIGNSESAKKILDNIKEKQDEINKAHKDDISQDEAAFLIQKAAEASKRNDFEAERKFLNEARTLREKIITDPLQAEQDFLDFTQKMDDSFKSQLTVVGKRREQEESAARAVQDQIRAATNLSAIEVQRGNLLLDIQISELQAQEDRDAEINKQRANLVELKSAFDALKGIKVDKSFTFEDANKKFKEISNQFDAILVKSGSGISDFAVLENAKSQIIKRLKEEQEALDTGLKAEGGKKELQNITQNIAIEKGLRSSLLDDLRKQLFDISTELNQKDISVFRKDELKAEQADLNDLRLTLLRVQNGKNLKAIDLDENQINKLNEAIDKAKVIGLTDEKKQELKNNLEDLFTTVNNSAQGQLDEFFKATQTTLDENKLIPGIDLAPIYRDINSIKKKILDLKTDIKITVDPNIVGDGQDIQGFAKGGIVPGNGFTDSILAALTPGEMVLTRGMTSQIMQSRTHNNSNTSNFGNISINIQGGTNPKTTAREVTKEISRLVARGQAKIGR